MSRYHKPLSPDFHSQLVGEKRTIRAFHDFAIVKMAAVS